MNIVFNNKVRLQTAFVGRAMNSNGVLSIRYKKFVKNSEGINAPLPDDKIYNAVTQNIVNRKSFLKVNGSLRNQYVNKYSILNDTIVPYIPPTIYNAPQVPTNIFSNTDGNTGILTPIEFWLNWIKSHWSRIRGKSTRFNLYSSQGVMYNTRLWDVPDLPFLFKLIPPDIKTLIWNGASDEPDFFTMIDFSGEIGAMEIVIFTAVEPVDIEQFFLDCKDSHCVLSPISNYLKNRMEASDSIHTKKKYQQHINAIDGKQLKHSFKDGLIQKYKNGMNKESLQELCDLLKIRIVVYSPFVLFSEVGLKDHIFEIKWKGDINHTFSYINTRLNHLELYTNDNDDEDVLNNVVCSSQETTYLSIDEMIQKLKWCLTNLDYFPYQEVNNIPRRILTAEQNYRLIDDSKDIIDAFEKKNNLQNNRISTDDPFHHYIMAGVHTNGGCDFNYREVGLMTNQIDMEKAFYNHKTCPYYNPECAFMSRPSIFRDFRKDGILTEIRQYANHNKLYIDNDDIVKWYCMRHTGYYKIDGLDATNLLDTDYNKWAIINLLGVQQRHTENIETIYDTGDIEENFGIYKNGGIYTHLDIKLLNDIGVDFYIIDGIMGESQELEWGDDMIKKFSNGVEQNDDVIVEDCLKDMVDKISGDKSIRHNKQKTRLYASWTGRQLCCSTIQSYQIKKDLKYLKAMAKASQDIGRSDKFYIYKERIGNSVKEIDKAKVSYDIGHSSHRGHIAGYIYAYQRISTILQLLNFKVENLYRVNTDGIYYKGECPAIVSTFRYENKIFPNNFVSPYGYSSHKFNLGTDYQLIPYDKLGTELYEDRNILLGAGGTGKTYRCMNDGGLLKVGYMAHSNKLVQSQNEWKGFKCPYQWILMDNPQLNKKVLKCNTLLIDEASTLNICDYRKIIKRCKGIKLIFMGDLGYQADPIAPKYENYEKWNLKTITNMMGRIETLTYNYRFKNCKLQKNICEKFRENCDKDFHKLLEFCMTQYGHIDYNQFYNEVKDRDIILSSRHIVADEVNKKLSTILKPKYSILKKTLCKKNGKTYYAKDVLYEKPPIGEKSYEIRYCYTIHSIQGETLEDDMNLYIMGDYLNCRKILYTAISRAKYHRQIKFVV